jgi:hypothetical protein
MFVAAEPFEEQLVLIIEERTNKEPVLVGHAKVPLTMVGHFTELRCSHWRCCDFDKSVEDFGLHIALCRIRPSCGGSCKRARFQCMGFLTSMYIRDVMYDWCIFPYHRSFCMDCGA